MKKSIRGYCNVHNSGCIFLHDTRLISLEDDHRWVEHGPGRRSRRDTWRYAPWRSANCWTGSLNQCALQRVAHLSTNMVLFINEIVYTRVQNTGQRVVLLLLGSSLTWQKEAVTSRSAAESTAGSATPESPYWWNYWTVLPTRSALRLGTHLAKQKPPCSEAGDHWL